MPVCLARFRAFNANGILVEWRLTAMAIAIRIALFLLDERSRIQIELLKQKTGDTYCMDPCFRACQSSHAFDADSLAA
jgi:hypothetical protein